METMLKAICYLIGYGPKPRGATTPQKQHIF